MADARFPIVAHPGTGRDEEDAPGLPSPERAYFVDEGPAVRALILRCMQRSCAADGSAAVRCAVGSPARTQPKLGYVAAVST